MPLMAFDRADPIDVALRVAAAITQAGGRYFVGGSLASSFQGEPRATNDIDLVVDLPLGAVAAFVRELGEAFEADVDMLREALIRRSSCNIFYLPTVVKIDLFAVGSSPFDASEFSRRRPVEVRPGGLILILKSPEDTVLRKLLWYQAGGGVSDRQWRDVVQVLRVSGAQMDPAYLSTWADRIGVVEFLRQAIADAGISPGAAV